MILDGKPLAEKIKERNRVEMKGLVPHLAVCLVGDDPSSEIYVSRKRRECESLGIKSSLVKFSTDVSQGEIIDFIYDWNEDKSIHGILVQLPLPKHIDSYAVLNAISPYKDVDGFHPVNIGRIAHDRPFFLPCTPQAVIEILDYYDIEMAGRNVAIINHSIVVGKPLSLMMMRKHATVTVCHEYTKNISDITSKADIVVTAVGRRQKFVLTKEMVSENAVVIDVGIFRLPNGKIVGDADFDGLKGMVRAITPVPGSVGPVTVQILMSNTIRAAKI